MKWALLLVGMVAGSVFAEPPLQVGSKRFTESYILGEVIRQTAEAAGETGAVHRQGLGNTAIVFNALAAGSVDIYPDYTGTIALEILKLDKVPPLAALNEKLLPLGLTVGIPLGFNNTYALAMRAGEAERLNIRSLSDLATHPELKLGLSQEFIGRKDGWEGLKRVYGLPQVTLRGLDHGLAYEGIAASQVDVIDIYSTDAKIERYKLLVLADDREYFPRYDALLVYRADLPKRFPQAWQALQKLHGAISTAAMIRLNGEAELQGREFSAIARDFLSGSKGGAVDKPRFLDRLFGPDFWRLLGEHLTLVFVSLAAGTAIGIPLAIAATRQPRLAGLVLGTTGVIQTIPSLALLAMLIPVVGRIGTLPALIALALYALLPIVRNTYVGLTQVPRTMVQAGLALGLERVTILRVIELPLALPTILAGVKTAAVINVGTATIAAFIGAGGFGERIAIGLALNDNAALLAGAIPAAVLALLMEWGFGLLDRLFVPRYSRPGPASGQPGM